MRKHPKGIRTTGKQPRTRFARRSFSVTSHIRMEKIPTDATFDAALRAVDSVALYDFERTQQADWDYAKEFCKFYIHQKPSADFHNVLDLPGLNPEATIQETADAINTATKNKITETVIPVLKKRLKGAGATYIDITPAVRHFSTLRVFVGGLDNKNLFRLITTKGNIDFKTGGAAEAKEALTEIDRRSGNRLSDLSHICSQIDDGRSDLDNGMNSLDFNRAMIGYFRKSDKNEVDSIINSEDALASLPPGIRLLWSYSPENNYHGDFYSLYALKEENGPASNLGQYITDARTEFDEHMGGIIYLKFNNKGTELFGRLTSDNLGRELAITVDDKVMSAPRIWDKITSGNAQITGSYDEATCKTLAAIFKGGIMPCDCEVIQFLPYSESQARNEY